MLASIPVRFVGLHQARSRVPKLLQPAMAVSPMFKTRNIVSTAVQFKPPIPEDHPKNASTDPDFRQDYPPVEERTDKEWEHQATAGMGRYTKLSMEGKVCVVTGAAGGLGNLFAKTFAESGSNSIVILDLQQDLAQNAADEIVNSMVKDGEAKAGEIEAVGYGVDVSNEQSVKDAFKKIFDKFGKVDVLVTAAGVVHNYKALDYPTEKMKQLYDINVNGTFYCARETASYMIAKQMPASIIFIGSMSGNVVNIPQPQTPVCVNPKKSPIDAYNSSKAAVRHMASSLAVEWAKKGIRVNCLSPGYMATSLTKHILDNAPDLKATWENLTPMGRLGEPEDLKAAITFLASDGSSFATGIDLQIDGGYTLT